jgi:hypothetical protein
VHESSDVQLAEGKIASAPAGARNTVMVVLDGFDPALPFGPCSWPPHQDGTTEPAEGDPCIVAVGGQRTWVLMWEPAGA